MQLSHTLIRPAMISPTTCGALRNLANIPNILANTIIIAKSSNIPSTFSIYFVLIPIFSEIGNYSRDNGLLFGGESLSVVLNYTDIIKHYLVGDFAFYDVLNGHGFFIFSSVIVIPLIILFFTNTKINIREKIFSFIMLLANSSKFIFINYSQNTTFANNLIYFTLTFISILLNV